VFEGKNVTAIVVAAGKGTRFGGDLPKQFLKIGGETVLEKAVAAFEAHPAVDQIAVVTGGDFVMLCEELCRRFAKVRKILTGGAQRQDSVYEGLKTVTDGLVLVHDGARPFVTGDVIDRVLEGAYNQGACVPCVPVKDTVRQVLAIGREAGQEAVPPGRSSRTLDRSALFSVQTPQGFEVCLLKEAFAKAFEEGFSGTDDAGLVERLGHPVALAEGDYANIKITTREDLPEEDKKMDMRVGCGYDVHQLVEGRRLILGGVDIPHTKGLLGHSDADVLIHALMDAILGAAAMGDIGKHFPDSDQQYKGISSMKLLEHVKRLISDEGYKVGNVDVTVMAQKPKIASYILQMRTNIAETLGIEIERVNVKGTTTEKLGFVGREEGIAAEAVCILYK